MVCGLKIDPSNSATYVPAATFHAREIVEPKSGACSTDGLVKAHSRPPRMMATTNASTVTVKVLPTRMESRSTSPNGRLLRPSPAAAPDPGGGFPGGCVAGGWAPEFWV